MNTKLIKSFHVAVAVVSMAALVSCNPEPDESDLFTSTGETAADFIKRKSELSSFDYILTRVGLDRNLSAWGEYTCFVPTNDAVAEHLEYLWNDPDASIQHNGMTELSLHGLTDSLCNEIAKYHLSGKIQNTIEIGGGGTTVNTLLGTPFQTSTDSLGYVCLNQEARIIEADSLVTNGIVHVIDKVIKFNNRPLMPELERHEEYSIFMEALKLTGLADSITRTWKLNSENARREYSITDYYDTESQKKAPLYWPKECRVMYTIFAEPNSVLENNGIHSLQDLINFANEQYGGAADWYDYLGETGNSVSTGTDYTNRFNALNMFVAYHILYAGMPQNELVFEYSSRWSEVWNYVNGCRPYDYYETMLPHTLLKIWNPAGTQLYINRYVRLNTLTDEIGTVGSAAMHTLLDPGIRIARTTDSDISSSPDDHSSLHTNIQTYNGYIHALRGMLVYHREVPKGVLHERMRFDSTTFIPEFINNGIRMSNSGEVSALNGGGSGARVAFPLDFFDNVVSYTDQNCFRYNVKGAYNAWQGDTFQGWGGSYDLAIKLPPLPSGNYEMRIFYTPMGHGSMMQFYMGTSKKQSSMVAVDIPLDARVAITDPRIGWTNYNEEEDLGIATDAAMRNHGYMRCSYGYQDHPERHDQQTGVNTDRNLRYTSTGNNALRKIMGRFDIKQSEERWFRIKSVVPDEKELKWQFDFVEFIPVEMVDQTEYLEDWF